MIPRQKTKHKVFKIVWTLTHTVSVNHIIVLLDAECWVNIIKMSHEIAAMSGMLSGTAKKITKNFNYFKLFKIITKPD